MEIIKLDKPTHILFDNERCIRCHTKFTLNNFMVYNNLGCFHLTCFKKYCDGQIDKHKKEIDQIKSEIEKLKPHEKEMICEILCKEKYG